MSVSLSEGGLPGAIRTWKPGHYFNEQLLRRWRWVFMSFLRHFSDSVLLGVESWLAAHFSSPR